MQNHKDMQFPNRGGTPHFALTGLSQPRDANTKSFGSWCTCGKRGAPLVENKIRHTLDSSRWSEKANPNYTDKPSSQREHGKQQYLKGYHHLCAGWEEWARANWPGLIILNQTRACERKDERGILIFLPYREDVKMSWAYLTKLSGFTNFSVSCLHCDKKPDSLPAWCHVLPVAWILRWWISNNNFQTRQLYFQLYPWRACYEQFLSSSSSCQEKKFSAVVP